MTPIKTPDISRGNSRSGVSLRNGNSKDFINLHEKKPTNLYKVATSKTGDDGFGYKKVRKSSIKKKFPLKQNVSDKHRIIAHENCVVNDPKSTYNKDWKNSNNSLLHKHDAQEDKINNILRAQINMNKNTKVSKDNTVNNNNNNYVPTGNTRDTVQKNNVLKISRKKTT